MKKLIIILNFSFVFTIISAQILIGNGYAWWYKNYAKNDKDLESAEKYARSNKLGLWKSSNPIAPWDYRRGKTNKTTSTSNSSKNLDSIVYATKSGKKNQWIQR